MKKLLGAVALTLACTSVSAANWNEESRGGFNSVHMYVPQTQSPVGNGRALMINLHGCAQANTELKTANWDKVADKWGMVVALPYATHMEGFSCWGYWTEEEANILPTRSTKDYGNLINLAKSLINDTSLNIDPKQVYISGLSSGASFANITACLAPDIFAGMGIEAGPSIGTTSSGAIGAFEQSDVAAKCLALAGSNSDALKTQIASFSRGSSDYTVSDKYLPQNAEGFAKLYGVNQSGTSTVTQGSRSANLTSFGGDRVTMLTIAGDGHAWSGGEGASGAYVGNAGINYGMYLAEYFANNNMRLGPVDNLKPEMSNVTATPNSAEDAVTIKGFVTVPNGTYLSTIALDIDGQTYNVNPQSSFSITVSLATDADYYATVTATTVGDSDGKERTDSASVSFTLGTPFVPPSWCGYLSAELQKQQTACNPPVEDDNNDPSLPSWCKYISDTTYITACQPK